MKEAKKPNATQAAQAAKPAARPANKVAFVALRLPVRLVKTLDAQARTNVRSRNAEATHILANALKAGA